MERNMEMEPIIEMNEETETETETPSGKESGKVTTKTLQNESMTGTEMGVMKILAVGTRQI